MDYRRDIDGLRSIAIIPVILFHLNVAHFEGGYLGVDVFFVLSGFLITSIISQEILLGQFTLANFFERRLRRLYPALVFMLVLSMIISFIILPPFNFLKFFESITWVSLFNSNLFFWLDVDYFKSDSNLNPLIHTWTLAVEEQYYIIFPFVLLFLSRRLASYLKMILVLLVLMSFLLFLYGNSNHPSATFYLLPTRFWEIGFGSLIALYFSNVQKIIDLRFHGYFSILGILFILIPFFIDTAGNDKPFFVLLFPVLGTGLIILFSKSSQFIYALLSNSILVFIGKLSYSLYLFHQPIISFSKYIYPENGSYFVMMSLVGIIIFSSLSYFGIEATFRNRANIKNKFIWHFSFLSALFFIIISIFITKIDKFPYERHYAKLLTQHQAIVASNINDRRFVIERIEVEQKTYKTLVLGSSRLMQFSTDNHFPELLNLSVSGAMIEDFLAIGVLAVNKFQPSEIFIGVDPWLFNSKNDDTRWHTIRDEYNEAISILNGVPQNKVIKKNDFSHLYAVYRAVNLSLNTIPVSDIVSHEDKIRKDGSRLYSLERASLNKGQIANTIAEYGFYNMENFDFDKGQYNKFIKLINFIKSKGIKVTFVLSPYHPDMYDLIATRKKEIINMELLFKRIAGFLNVNIIGSYNPRICKCSEDNFYDAIHPKNECIQDKVIYTSILK